MTDRELRGIAERLLVDLGIVAPADIDVDAIAFHLGARTVYRSLDGCEARIAGCGDKAIISVNSAARRERQRFSVAHEVGHWLLHRGSLLLDCRAGDSAEELGRAKPREQLANAFAAELLMPLSLFTPLARTKRTTLDTAGLLGDAFQTSLTATALRLTDHGAKPAMLVCSTPSCRLWYRPGSGIPSSLRPHAGAPDPESQASLLLRRELERSPPPRSVPSSLWFDAPGAERFSVLEQARIVDVDTVLTMLTWEDERQLTAEDDDDD